MTRTTWPLFITLSLATGCASEPSSAASSATATTQKSAGPTASGAISAPVAPAAFKPDAEVVKLVKAIVAGCTVADDGWIRGCKSGEEDALFAYVRKSKTEAYFGTLADLALGEGKTDKKLFTAATHEIGFLPTDIGDDWYAKNGSSAAVDLLFKAVAAVEPSRLSRVAPGVAAVALAGGKRAELMTLLDARPEKDELRNTAVSYWIKYGGVAALGDLDHFAASKDASARYNASFSPGVAIPGPFGGTPVSDDAKKTICDAAKKYLESADDKVFAGAAESMGRCKGPYIDAAIDALEKRDGGDKVPKNDTDRLYHLCWAEGVVGRAANGTKEQCERALDLLEKIATKDGADPEDVFMAVFAAKYFAQHHPELAPKAQALRDRFKGSSDKRTADEAKKPIK